MLQTAISPLNATLIISILFTPLYIDNRKGIYYNLTQGSWSLPFQISYQNISLIKSMIALIRLSIAVANTNFSRGLGLRPFFLPFAIVFHSFVYSVHLLYRLISPLSTIFQNKIHFFKIKLTKYIFSV